MEKNPASQTITNNIYESMEDMSYNESYKLEKLLLHAVESGNIEYLKNFMPETADYNTGDYAPDHLRALKNSIIVTTTLATRAAISGGLDFETAYQTSDYYITEAEKLYEPITLRNLHQFILLDFAEKVRKKKSSHTSDNICQMAIQYIHRNINQPISVTDVARYVGFSRAYFSKYFKAALGFPVAAFILRCRLEESRNLLTNTDKSLSEISNYLCFSSQSHFQKAFKKQYHITPYKYRIEGH
ncbi:MAG: helix-turn-helix domain-containing protein [Muribaculaceae bacterium]|nr:helix-turn-helix domain-containing protein [Muribaculaceae bacterium]